MDSKKEKQLLETYHLWVSSFMDDTSVDILDTIAYDDIMGYGSALEEKLFGIEQIKELAQQGTEQRKDFKDYTYTINIVEKQYSPTEDTAIVIADLPISFISNGIKNDLPLRISTVLFYENKQWKVIHWHGSLGLETDGDSWHQDEWKRENERLQKKVDEQTEKLRKSLEDLKATQAQLIQSEKMASLGELTAGIAHEIQNPLNFVNNFSEVSNELIDEMTEELDNGDIEEAKAIANDVKQNLDKINYHGKRADSIVKGMLQHSRNTDGEKEATDINKLADEYLRLAYHGLRAKDKSFNASLETHFDTSLPAILVKPQDVGRVLLNLFTNAFYAVNEKFSEAKTSEPNYAPTVSVTTKQIKNSVEITVTDNGNGIPQDLLKKIFDPFFTTKPTGKGTGLGLSMSYDIIKNHEGTITVNSNQGKSTEFVINLPLKTHKS